MKIQWNLYVPVEIRQKIENMAKIKGTTASNFVVLLLQKQLKEYEKTKLITCPICGAEYSDKLSVCPFCEQKRIEKEIEIEKEKELYEKEQKRIEKEKIIRDIKNKIKEFDLSLKQNENEIKIFKNRGETKMAEHLIKLNEKINRDKRKLKRKLKKIINEDVVI